jgi:hypothetical protein
MQLASSVNVPGPTNEEFLHTIILWYAPSFGSK